MKEEKLQGISIYTLTKVGAFLAIAFFIGIVFLIVDIISTNDTILEKTDNYTTCEDAVMTMKETTSYLSDECRQYVKTENFVHLENYAKEITEAKRRDKAVRELYDHGIDVETEDYKTAVELAKDLEQMEIHAMKLMVCASGLEDDDRVPRVIRQYELSNYEKNLSKYRLKERAEFIIYSAPYFHKQEEFSAELKAYRKEMTGSIEEGMEHSSEFHDMLINVLIGFLVALFAALFFSVVILNDAILRPISIYLECIESGTRMPLRGSIETQKLAVAFNNMYEKHKLYENDRKFEGKRDHLTGAINSIGFNECMYEIASQKKKTTLLLVEIDDYEELEKYHSKDSINVVLIELYSLICKIAEFKDDVFKIDSGLYAMILYDKDSENKEDIQKTFTKLREKILDSKLASEITVSAGVAFTDISGFDQTLLNNANVALYQTKDKGGNGIEYYEYQ